MYKCSCGEEYRNKSTLDEHKIICDNQNLSCELCNERFSSSSQIRDHLNQCGNKTVKCSKCSKYIRRAIYIFHSDNNCQNLDEDNSTFNKRITNDNDYYHRRSIEKNIETKEQNSQKKSLRTNEKEIDDDHEYIPCELRYQQIQLSNYNNHIRLCLQNESDRREDSIQSMNNRTDSKEEENSRSNLNAKFNCDDTSITSNDQSDIPSSSFQKVQSDSERKLLNSRLNVPLVSKESAVSRFHEKTSLIEDTLRQDYYRSEVNHVVEKVEFNLLIIGSPRVGKSELINALCDGESRAETSRSLSSCTDRVKPYILEDNQQRTPGIKAFRIVFYDTPGIESWTNEGGQTTMLTFIKEKDPLCIIYCASPGSFADLKQLHPVLEFCKSKQIFCALVCTDMWSSVKRKEVIREFENELNFFGERIERLFNQTNGQSSHKVTFFGHGALCTMVNSIEYYDPELSHVKKPVQGIDELIHCIMESLNDQKLLGWCNAVLYRRTYWQKIRQKIDGFCSVHIANRTYLTFEQITENTQDLFQTIRKTIL